MTKQLVKELERVASQLQSERLAHEAAIAEIDAGLASLGIEAAGPRKRTRVNAGGKQSKKSTKRKKLKRSTKRKKYRMTASEFVIATIKKTGAKGATGSQLSKAWKSSGRPGDAYNTLGALTRAKQIKRSRAAKGRGSVYRVM